MVHLGPSESKGGMSSVISILVENPPDGWSSNEISTHSDLGLISKFREFLRARKKLINLIRCNEIDIAHIHVTHSLSWWRKKIFIEMCHRNGIPVVVHIHSGMFDIFCMGFAGKSVSRTLNRDGIKVVLLEERWIERLKRWIPDDAQVVLNSSKRTIKRENKECKENISLLLAARNSRIKGHKFALEIIASLDEMGKKSTLTMTGISRIPESFKLQDSVNALGWISEKEKRAILKEVDFVLVPSEYEGSSMVVIECIVNRIPCIVSPASSETIGIEKLVVPLERPEDWARRIIEISGSEQYVLLNEELSGLAEKYSIESAKIKFGELYHELIENTSIGDS